MFDELIFHDIVDLGIGIPPILPNISYQTKSFDNCLRLYNVRQNIIDFTDANAKHNYSTAPISDKAKNHKEITFYCGIGRDEKSILERSMERSTNEEISKMLFFTDLFCGDWLEYLVTVDSGVIIGIKYVFSSFGDDGHSWHAPKKRKKTT